MESNLQSIRKHTKIVADTGDFNLIAKYLPIDSTTNPSLIYKACSLPQYKHLMDTAIKVEKSAQRTHDDLVERILDRLSVLFGLEILKIIPGRVSTEIDAKLSFDTDGMVKRGLHLIDMFEQYGISSDRIYLKIPSTWEGIQAAKIFKTKHPHIHVNMTLLFSLVQAVACAEVQADLISPFVGRITDWYKTFKNLKVENIQDDPGVINVRKIFNYYKRFNISTVIMGASFRNIDQIKALCGIDALTISPALLEELNSQVGEVPQFQSPSENIEKIHMDEKSFRWLMNCDEMASFKLAEGIRLFHQDTESLRFEIKKLMN